MSKTFIALGFLCLFLAWAMPRPAAAAEPQDTLKAYIDQFVQVLKNPAYPKGSPEQAKKLWPIVEGAFDFQGISIMAVGAPWRQFTAQQKTDFVEAFTRLLRATYLKKVQDGYQNQDLSFLGQDMLGQNKALVKTTIQRPEGPTPVDYRMWLRDGAWKVYDVAVEGVSLVKNYRSQFGEILLKQNPDQLIAQVRKQAEQASQP